MKKIKVRGGLKIPLHGSVKNKEFDHIHPKFVGILADDYFSLKPKFLVKEGDSVTTGDPIFEDKTNPGFMLSLQSVALSVPLIEEKKGLSYQ